MKTYRGTVSQFNGFFVRMYSLLALFILANGLILVVTYSWQAELDMLSTLWLGAGVIALTVLVVLLAWRNLVQRRGAWLESWLSVDETGIEQHDGRGGVVRIDGSAKVVVRDSMIWLVIQDSTGRSIVAPKFLGGPDIAEIRAVAKKIGGAAGA